MHRPFRRAAGAALFCSALLLCVQSAEDTPVISWTTLAGRAPRGTEDGPAASARFNHPSGLARDAAGNVYVADSGNHTIRMISPAGIVSTLAGATGLPGNLDGPGTAARFNNPRGLALDSAGNLYVADAGNFTIRKVTPAGIVTTLAGQPGKSGTADGPAAAALFDRLDQIAADASGTVYVLDHGIRKIASGTVTTFFGSGSAIYPLTGASYPVMPSDGLAVDAAGNVICGGRAAGVPYGVCILRLDVAGVPTMLLGPNRFWYDAYSPHALSVGPFVSDGQGGFYFGQRWLYYYGEEQFVGHFTNGGEDNFLQLVLGREGMAETPQAIVPNGSGDIILTLASDHAVLNGNRYDGAFAGTSVIAISPDPSKVGGVRFSNLADLAADAAGNVWVAESSRSRMPWDNESTGRASVWRLGTDGGATTPYLVYASFSPLPWIYGLAAQGDNVLVSSYEGGYGRYFTVAPAGTVTALGPMDGYAKYPAGVAVAGPTGEVGAANFYDRTLYRWDPAGSAWRPLAGASPTVENPDPVPRDGTGSTAIFGNIVDLAADSHGDFFVLDVIPKTDTTPTRTMVRKVTINGVVTTVGRDLRITTAAYPDGISPVALAINHRDAVVLLYPDHTVRLVGRDGDPVVIGGSSGVLGNADGNGTAARFESPRELAVDAQDNLYVIDANGATVRKGLYLGTVPVITTQPVGGAATPGGPFTLSVGVSGDPAPTLQWYRDGNRIDGATGATFQIASVSAATTGSYTVKATNPAGSVTSVEAVVTLRASSGGGGAGGGNTGGGGGGAPSLWFLGLLATLAAIRRHRSPAA